MGLLHGSAADCSELHWLGKSASGSWDNSCVLLLTPSYLKEAWHPGKRHRNLPSTVRSYWSLWSWLSWLVKISSRSLLTESSLNTNLSTINAAALFKYSNRCTLDCLAMSTGSGNFVGWLPLSENPSTDVAAAVTLDLTMIRRKSRSAQYAVWIRLHISPIYQGAVREQRTAINLWFARKNFLTMSCRVEKKIDVF